MNPDTENKMARGRYATELNTALEHAQRLTDTRPHGDHGTAWAHAAAQVGDLAVLALAFRS